MAALDSNDLLLVHLEEHFQTAHPQFWLSSLRVRFLPLLKLVCSGNSGSRLPPERVQASWPRWTWAWGLGPTSCPAWGSGGLQLEGAGRIRRCCALETPEKRQKTLKYSLYFKCTPFFSKKANVHFISSSISCVGKCHKTSQIFTRTEQTFVSARSLGIIFKALNALNDQNLRETQEIFSIVCGICRSVDKKTKIQMAQPAKKDPANIAQKESLSLKV